MPQTVTQSRLNGKPLCIWQEQEETFTLPAKKKKKKKKRPPGVTTPLYTLTWALDVFLYPLMRPLYYLL